MEEGKLSGWQQLAILRDFTRRTGALHGAQVQQLKMWPLIAFPHITSHEFDWDVVEHWVRFRLRPARRKSPPRDMRKRLEALDRNVKAMLGNEWSIEVFNEVKAGEPKSIFKSHAGKDEPDPGSAAAAA